MDRPIDRPTGDRAGEMSPGQIEPPEQAATPESSPKPWGATIPRRRLLRMLGLGALSVAPMSVLPELLRTVGPGRPVEPVEGSRKPATTRDGRIRQWTMIIDLRSCDGCQSVGGPPRCTAACIQGPLAPEPLARIEVSE